MTKNGILIIENHDLVLGKYKRKKGKRRFEEKKRVYIDKILSLKKEILYRTPLLPNGTRLYLSQNEETIIVVEEPPQVRTIKWKAGHCIRQYHFAFPYVVFIIKFEMQAVKDVFVYYRNQPLKKGDNELFLPNLPNLGAQGIDDEADICLGTLEVDVNLSLAEKVEMIINNFWESAFNPEEYYERTYFCRSKKLDKRVSSFAAWQKATKENPLFVLEIDWLRSDMDLFDYVKYQDTYVCEEKIIDYMYKGDRR
jgi:hypothetical protein